MIKLDTIICEEDLHIDTKNGIFVSLGKKVNKALIFTGQGVPVYEKYGEFTTWESCFSEKNKFENDPKIEILNTSLVQPYIVKNTIQSCKLLKYFGVQTNIGIGYSIGEVSAMFWAGMISEDDALKISRLRGKSMYEYGEKDGGMLAVRCSQDFLDKYIDNKNLFITCNNGNNNYVLGGDKSQLVRLEKILKKEQLPYFRLKVSQAFHTPKMNQAAQAFNDLIKNYRFNCGNKTIISTLTGEVLKEKNLQKYLIEQMVKPVNFSEAINKVKQKVDIFLELGPGRVLTNILEDSKKTAVALDFCSDSIKGFLGILASSFISGDKVELSKLRINRYYKKFNIDTWNLNVFENPCEIDFNFDVKFDKSKIVDQKLSNKVEIVNENKPENNAKPFQETENDVVEFLIYILSEKLEIPIEVIDKDDKIMSKLHVNSLALAEIISITTEKFQKAYTVFSEASILANTDASIRNVAKMIFKGERLKDFNKKQINLSQIPNWNHIFVKKQLENKLIKAGTTLKQESGEVFWSGIKLKEIEHIKSNLSNLGNVALFIYDKSNANVLDLFIEFLKSSRIKKSKIISLVELNFSLENRDCKDEIDLKPILRSFKNENLEKYVISLEIKQQNLDLTTIICDELSFLSDYREVVYELNKRSEPKIFPIFMSTKNLTNIINQDIILATGGGKGIMYESIKNLALKTKSKLVILGRASPITDVKLKINLDELEKLGIEYKYYQADVTNSIIVKETIKSVEKEFGYINIIMHGAGINTPKKIDDLTLNDFKKTLLVKVQGLKNILHVINKDKLKLLIGYGSVIAEIGMHGNSDYAFANDQLAKLISNFQKENQMCRGFTIEWSVWDEIGMGVNLNTIDRLKQMELWPILPSKGNEILETLIANHTDKEERYIVTGRMGKIPTLKYLYKKIPLGRFISNISHYTPDVEVISEVNINIEDDIYLKNHIIDGNYVFPLVMILEGAAQVSTILLKGGTQFKFSNLHINKSIIIEKNKSNVIRFIAIRKSQESIDFIVQSEDSKFEVNCFEFSLIMDDESLGGGDDLKYHKLNVNIEEFYDAILFHKGPFRRIKSFSKINSVESMAHAKSNKSDIWYGNFIEEISVLGDPGLNDAAIHCHQACRPSQRLLPVEAGEIKINIGDFGTDYYIYTKEIKEIDDLTYIDVFVVNKEGKVKMSWKNLVLKQVKGILFSGRWNKYSLAPYLEYRVKHSSRHKRRIKIPFELAGKVISEFKKGTDSLIVNIEDRYIMNFKRYKNLIVEDESEKEDRLFISQNDDFVSLKIIENADN